jgi:hypothetical protein
MYQYINGNWHYIAAAVLPPLLLALPHTMPAHC